MSSKSRCCTGSPKPELGLTNMQAESFKRPTVLLGCIESSPLAKEAESPASNTHLSKCCLCSSPFTKVALQAESDLANYAEKPLDDARLHREQVLEKRRGAMAAKRTRAIATPGTAATPAGADSSKSSHTGRLPSRAEADLVGSSSIGPSSAPKTLLVRSHAPFSDDCLAYLARYSWRLHVCLTCLCHAATFRGRCCRGVLLIV